MLKYEHVGKFIMYRHKFRFLFAVLCLLILTSAAQATDLQIVVQDSLDNTPISHASVYLNGINQGMTTSNGTFLISGAGMNDVEIEVMDSGYNTWDQIVSKNTTLLYVNLTRQTLLLNVSLYDTDTLNPVSNVSVNLSGTNFTQTKLTDATGVVTFGVESLTHYTLAITSPDYQPRSESVDIQTSNQQVQYWLLSGNRYTIVVRDNTSESPISGAGIQINGMLIGTTDDRGSLSTSLTRGLSYTLVVSKDGYQPYSETRRIAPSDALETVELMRAPLGAFIYVVDENKGPISNAAIYINGSLSGTTNQYGRSTFPNLLTGTYPIEISKDGYVTITDHINVTTQQQDYTFTMPFQTAQLTIYTQDKDQKIIPNATIAINGVSVGSTNNDGQFVTRVTLNSLYNISASKDNYQAVNTETQVIQGNSTGTVTLVLEKNLDWGLIGLVIIGAIAVLVLFAVIRMFGRRKRRHVVRRNEI